MNWSWILRMAWRDSRKNRGRLFLFIASIVLGIAALVALNSFNENISRNIDGQAAELIGADLVLESRRLPSDDAKRFIDSLAQHSTAFAREERMMSMARFPKTDESRLVQLRAIDGSYPFYGQINSFPTTGEQHFTAANQALVDRTLMLQFKALVQDTIQLGSRSLPIGAELIAAPGQSAVAASIAPTVFVSLQSLADAGLKQTGSRIEYHYYYKYGPDFDVDAFVDRMTDRLEELQLRHASITSTKEDTGRAFADVGKFMKLVGFIALILGCIGVASAVHLYMREKLPTVALLRCLGTTAKQTFFIFLTQLATMGLLGGVVGALIGTAVQYLLPALVQDFLPVTLDAAVSWSAIAQGIALGVVIAVLFALAPLLEIRRVSPLRTLQVGDEAPDGKGDPLRWWIYTAIVLFLFISLRLQLDTWLQAAYFLLGIALTFAILYGVAKGSMVLVRRYFPQNWPYLWRQGLSNLYRPNNQTVVLIVSIGLGTALIGTLFFVQEILLQRIQRASDEQQANLVLFDIQPGQKQAVKAHIKAAGFPVLEEVPIVTLQVAAVNGRSLPDVLKDSLDVVSTRIFRGEIRATYRDSLDDAEKIVAGKWQGSVEPGDTAQVSMEKRYADRVGVKLGDRLLLNVQGALIPAVVSSMREVDWNRFQTNFRMVLAKGTVDDAPQFHVLTTRVDGADNAAVLQQSVVSKFPNIALINLDSVLKILEDLMLKIGFIIRFMSSFSIATGIVVLISAVVISRYQRVRENVLLRTLGASRKQIVSITLCEYAFLGLLSALTGLLVAVAAGYLLAAFLFNTIFLPSGVFMLLLVLFVTVLTTLIGILNSLSALNRSPLEILRKV